MKTIFAMALVLGMILIGMAGAVVFADNVTLMKDFGVGGNASVGGTFSAKDTQIKGDLQVDHDLSATNVSVSGLLDQIGDLADLETSDKNSVVAAINESYEDVSDLLGYSLKMNVIAGGSAGNHTLTGVHVGDELGGVVYATKTAGNLTTLTDLMTEFTGSGKGIIATNVIANGGGTNTAGGYLLVSWMDKT